jgi:hypothetical protein
MATHRRRVVAMLCLVGPLVAASCLQSAEDMPDTADTDVRVSEVDEAASLRTYRECLVAGRRGPEAREAFCRSLPDPPRGSCWSKVHSRIAWDIWCGLTF